MNYYQSKDGKTILRFNPILNQYTVDNSIECKDKRISKELFDSFQTKTIPKHKYNELLNLYFKDVQHTWVYNGNKFKKLPNFKGTKYELSTNYTLGEQVPYHEEVPNLIDKYDKRIIVYHRGRVYLHSMYYKDSIKKGCLYDIKTNSFVKWVSLTNCAPILNLDTNRII